MTYKTYEEYIHSNLAWLGDVPKNWELERLAPNCNIITGHPFNSDLFTFEGLPLIRIRDLKDKTTSMFWNSDYPDSAVIHTGDLLVGMDGDFDVVSWKGDKALLNQRIFKINAINKLYDSYLKYILQFPVTFINDLTMSTTVKHLAVKDVNDIILPLPTKYEQQQIANYLDKKTAKIDATIAKNEELIRLLEEKRVALINQVVTKGLNPDVVMKDSGVEWIGEIPEHWEVDCLKHNVNLNAMTLTDTTDSNYEFDYVDIGSVSLENGIEKYEHMLFEDAPSRARRIVKKDDVIISTVRTYLKAIAVIPDKENVIVSTGFAVLTPTKVNSRYLGYMVKSEYFTNLVSAYSVGVSYPAINSTDLVNLDILIPSDEEQQQIADYLDKEISNINSIINKVSDNIELLEEYKTSLIHHVVTGKIDVRGEEI